MKKILNIIHSPDVELEVKVTPTVYAQNGYIYIIPDKMSLLEHSKTIYQAEKERNNWIRKYDRVLSGLNYWKNKAMEKE